MEVTRNNFMELLPVIEKAIEDADVLCIDGEFTGLNCRHKLTAMDSPPEYYKKLRSGGLDFLLVQFGLATFQYKSENKSYKSQVFNFYIFPKPFMNASDERFLCQSSSIDFLASNGFDFNKLFREGIPYLNKSHQENLKEKAASRRNYKVSNINTIPVPIQFKDEVNKACEEIGELFKESSKTEIHLKKCSAFVRKLIYQSAKEKFGDDKIQLETVNGSIVARRIKGKTEEEIEEEFRLRDEAKIEEGVGFSKVIRALTVSEKLIVGHNMLLDICHMAHRFCDILPYDYNEFKEMIHCLFPKILDTKYLCSNSLIKDVMKSTILEDIYEAINEKPFEKIEIEDTEMFRYDDTKKFHEGGYDAYITGVSFLTLLKYLQKENGESLDCLPSESVVLRPHLNKVFLNFAPDTCINLAGKDVLPSRDHVFLINFPKIWTGKNISELFSAFGRVQIYWLDDTSAWVSLYEKKEASGVIKSLVKGNKLKKDVSVIPYSLAIKLDTKKREAESPPKDEIKFVKRLKSMSTVQRLPQGEIEREDDPISYLEKGIETVEDNFVVDDTWG